jgi:N4-gp56 family major capsid protein
MATATYPGAGGNTAKTEAATFIPEIWSDEIIAAYQKNLKMAPLVKKLAMSGKKGDKLHIPKPVRGDANAKAADTAVTIIANTEGELTVDIDRHFEYSRLIEDIVEVQALNSLRQFYTEDAGYALATNVDSALIAEANSGFTAKKSFVAGGIADAGPAVAFNDAGFRAAIAILDENNVPGDSRVLVVSPSVKADMLGVSNYVSTDFVTGKPVTNGHFGSIYGVDIVVSTNLTGSAGESNCILMHKDALVFAEQLGVRTQTQYKQEFLADLLTADTLYGVETYRPENGLTIAALV